MLEEPLGEKEPLLVELQASRARLCECWLALLRPGWVGSVCAAVCLHHTCSTRVLSSCHPLRQTALQVALQPAAPGASPRAAGRITAALGRAQDAAAAHVQAGPQATGERLHANFLAVLQTVEQHDSHLLAELETGFITAYKVGFGVRAG